MWVFFCSYRYIHLFCFSFYFLSTRKFIRYLYRVKKKSSNIKIELNFRCVSISFEFIDIRLCDPSVIFWFWDSILSGRRELWSVNDRCTPACVKFFWQGNGIVRNFLVKFQLFLARFLVMNDEYLSNFWLLFCLRVFMLPSKGPNHDKTLVALLYYCPVI